MNLTRRFVIALAFTAVGTTLAAQRQTKAPAPADSIVASALKIAQAKNKTVLVNFGSSWCVWCKRLDAMLASAEVGKIFADNYVIAHLTLQESPDKKALENPGAEELASAAGVSTFGLPVYFFLDSSGKRIATSQVRPDGRYLGFPTDAEGIKAFDNLLMKTAPRMTAAQRTQISNYLARQKN